MQRGFYINHALKQTFEKLTLWKSNNSKSQMYSCVKTFSTSNSMKKRINAGHKRDHKCKYCGRVFSEACIMILTQTNILKHLLNYSWFFLSPY